MSVPIGVLVNPRSRYLRHQRHAVPRLQRILGDRGVLIEARDIAHVTEIAARFKAAEVGVVGIVGGDGTAGFAVSAL